MKKPLSKLLAAAAAIGLSGVVNAATIVDVESVNSVVPPTASWTHTLEGFTLGSATSASLSIQLFDDVQSCESYFFRLCLDADLEAAIIVVDLIDLQDGSPWHQVSWGDWSGALGVTSLADLNSTGQLNVSVSNWPLLGDFGVGDSTLSVETRDVPLPGTLALLGLGLAGLGLTRRRATA